MANVHIVIVNYNTAPLLRRCLDHVFASVDAPLSTVTVVDNGSSDGSLALLRATFPQVRAIDAGRNRGFAGGNNLGLRAVLYDLPPGADRCSEYVLLLNTDLLLEPETLRVLADFLTAMPDAGIVGPRVERPDGSLDFACRRSFPTPVNSLFKLLGLSRRFPGHPRLAAYNLTHLDPASLTEVDAVMGACMLVRVAAIDDAGLLDQDFFMYGEDLDWAWRIKHAGWRVFYQPATRVLHFKGATSSRQSERMIVEFYRAMWLFYRKHYASRLPRPLTWLVAAGIVARGVLAFSLNLLRPPERKRVT